MSTRKLLSRRELAVHFQINPQTVTKWERAGMPIAELGRPGRASRFSIAETNKWLKEREKAAKTEGVDLIRERARKERAQALVQEQTLAIRARDLVPRAEVEAAWSSEIAAVRAKLLSWPATLSDQLFRAAELGRRNGGGAQKVESALQAAVEELLFEFSGTRPETPEPKARSSRKKATTKKKTTKKAPRKKAPKKGSK